MSKDEGHTTISTGEEKTDGGERGDTGQTYTAGVNGDDKVVHNNIALQYDINNQQGYDELTVMERPVYSQEGFDEGHPRAQVPPVSLRARRDALLYRCCSIRTICSAVTHLFPFLSIMRSYNPKTDLIPDVLSGVIVGIINIPQGMAYGLLTNLPPVYGLYVSFFPVLLYFFLGTSRHIAIGTFAVVSLMIAGVIDRYKCEQYTDYDDVPSLSNDTSLTLSFGTNDSSSVGGILSTLTVNTSAIPSLASDSTSANIIVPSELEIDCKLSIAVTVTFVAGLLQICMGLLQLGFVNNYLSEPLTRGFTTATAIHVFTSQVKHVLAVPTQRYTGAFKLIKIYKELFSSITQTNLISLSLSAACIVVLVVFKELINPRVKKRLKFPLPTELFVVIATTLLVSFAELDIKHDVVIVGEVPTGIPPPRAPAFSEMGAVLADALSVAVVSFAISMSLVNLFASKNNYNVDANQELLAYGISNSVSSFFNCFMAAGSMSRTIIQEGVGGKTQVASLVNCAIILVVMFLIGPLFEKTPNCALAAIIIVALKNMFMQVTDLKKLWTVSKIDFMIWLVAFTATLLIDVDIGLMIAVAFSLLTVVFRTQRPYTCILGRVPGTDIYRNIKVYTTVEEFPGVKIFRFESSLYYANCEHFVRKIYKKTKLDPRKVRWDREQRDKKEARENARRRKKCKQGDEDKVHEQTPCDVATANSEPSLSHVIIDCTTMAYIDWVGVTTLSKVIREYRDVGVTVMLAGCKVKVRDMLESAGFYKKIDKSILYVTLHDAVVASLCTHPQLQEQVSQLCV